MKSPLVCISRYPVVAGCGTDGAVSSFAARPYPLTPPLDDGASAFLKPSLAPSAKEGGSAAFHQVSSGQASKLDACTRAALRPLNLIDYGQAAMDHLLKEVTEAKTPPTVDERHELDMKLIDLGNAQRVAITDLAQILMAVSADFVALRRESVIAGTQFKAPKNVEVMNHLRNADWRGPSLFDGTLHAATVKLGETVHLDAAQQATAKMANSSSSKPSTKSQGDGSSSRKRQKKSSKTSKDSNKSLKRTGANPGAGSRRDSSHSSGSKPGQQGV